MTRTKTPPELATTSRIAVGLRVSVAEVENVIRRLGIQPAAIINPPTK